MEKEQEFKAAVHEFYDAYMELKGRMEVRMESHFSLYADRCIEIWRHKGGAGERLLLRAKTEKDEEDADVRCYRKAAYLIKSILKEQERRGEAYGGV